MESDAFSRRALVRAESEQETSKFLVMLSEINKQTNK